MTTVTQLGSVCAQIDPPQLGRARGIAKNATLCCNIRSQRGSMPRHPGCIGAITISQPSWRGGVNIRTPTLAGFPLLRDPHACAASHGIQCPRSRVGAASGWRSSVQRLRGGANYEMVMDMRPDGSDLRTSTNDGIPIRTSCRSLCATPQRSPNPNSFYFAAGRI